MLVGLIFLAGCGSNTSSSNQNSDTNDSNSVSSTNNENDSNDENGEDIPIDIPLPTAGTRIEPPREVADFTLINQDNIPTSLSDFRGKPVILYFGYTFCPDICPTTLAELVYVKRNLQEHGKGDDVTFIFASVDGERDTPEVIKPYLAAFDEDFIGLTGTEKELRKIGVDYGLFFEKSQVQGTSADYLVDHTAATFLIDAEGRLHTVYAYATPADVISNDLLTLLNQETEDESQEPGDGGD